MSAFDNLPRVSILPHIVLIDKAVKDTDPRKVDLLVGAYRDENSLPYVLPVVKRVEQVLAQRINKGLDNHNYSAPDGLSGFSAEVARITLGEDCQAFQEGRLVCSQPSGNCSGLRVTFEVLKQILPTNYVYASDPTWLTIDSIVEKSGFQLMHYRYWDEANKCLDFVGLTQDLEAAPRGSVVIFQPAAHNPTGVDPTQEQWKIIAKIVQSRDLMTVFDSCYQGFVSGDLDQDAWPMRHFASLGMEMIINQSFSKTLGLYGERVASFLMIVNDKSIIPRLKVTIFNCLTGLTGPGAAYGAKIAREVFSSLELESEWRDSVRSMTSRIKENRRKLRDRLEQLNGCPGSWSHITRQNGMFSYTGLTPKQCAFLAVEKKVYIYPSGRANLGGLTDRDLEYVAQSFHEAQQIQE
ncbi:hypothetical protein TCAL_13213 [Tigriopus californicus]|uniref:Aspartate aminotransferase n=2 Tax=Tigriopus californicus TaxID=6832 RepID=S5JU14_TIGCA|nr:aspartate aminotransferase, cytoplasmic-like [Tigriopus californicus]AGR04105.1 GOT1Sr [Tigriopus californicus]TRY77425.1 hypothetical protein TCAL_13213 [Tigriopus californicus]